MIRTLVLAGLLAVIFYCALANAARAGETAGLVRAHRVVIANTPTRDHREFIPGSLALSRAAARYRVVSALVPVEPNA